MSADIRALSATVAVSPQVSPGDLSALVERGFLTLVNNRPDGEDLGQPTGAEIESAARTAGMTYVALPVRGMPDAATVAAFRALLDQEGPVFAYCRSGTRSAMTWALAERARGGDADAIRAAALALGYDLSRLPL